MVVVHQRNVRILTKSFFPEKWIAQFDVYVDDKLFTLIGTIIAAIFGGHNGHPRKTKDTSSDGEDDRWIDLLGSNHMTLLNGNTKGDWQGELTHMSNRGMSCIDYRAISRWRTC